MLRVNQLTGFGVRSSVAGGGAKAATFIGVSAVGSGDPVTFTAVSIGAESASRLVVVFAFGYNGVVLNSATIGGISATIVVQQNSSRSAAIIAAMVPTGTTADVVLDYASPIIAMHIATWTVSNATTATATSSGSNDTGAAIVLSTAADGVAIGGVISNNSGPTWTNLSVSAHNTDVNSIGAIYGASASATTTGSSTSYDTSASSTVRFLVATW